MFWVLVSGGLRHLVLVYQVLVTGMVHLELGHWVHWVLVSDGLVHWQLMHWVMAHWVLRHYRLGHWVFMSGGLWHSPIHQAPLVP